MEFSRITKRKQKNKVKWTVYEDELLKKAIEEHGTDNWAIISKYVPSRSGKQCRERWTVQINPDLYKNKWEEWEDKLLTDLVTSYGNKWVLFTSYLNNLSALSIKNRWNLLKRHSITKLKNNIPIIDYYQFDNNIYPFFSPNYYFY